MPETPKPMISFTFDDFPKSAAEAGADVMNAHDIKATYYTCSGMLEKTSILGELYDAGDLKRLIAQGHEIASHTHTHLDCSLASTTTVLAEIEQNRAILRELASRDSGEHLAWPYGETHVAAKRSAAKKLATARGILPGINKKGSDLMQLRAVPIGPDDASIEQGLNAIDTVEKTGGWLIFFTHDVTENPTSYGTTPDRLRRLAERAQKSAAAVLPVSQAANKILSGADNVG